MISWCFNLQRPVKLSHMTIINTKHTQTRSFQFGCWRWWKSFMFSSVKMRHLFRYL